MGVVMFGVTGRGEGRTVGIVPVVDQDGAVRELGLNVKRARCAACGESAEVVVEGVEGIATTLCVDFRACAARFREGVSPATYGAVLRGDILGGRL
jgi:hypothetical protein